MALSEYDELIAELLESTYWIVDILPEQVPAVCGGQYFAAEQYFLRPDRIAALRRKYAELFLKLNCYRKMAVSFDGGETWEENPEPERFAAQAEGISGHTFLRVLFPEEETLFDLDNCDTSVTVYHPDPTLLEMVRELAAAAGLFVWQPPEA